MKLIHSNFHCFTQFNVLALVTYTPKNCDLYLLARSEGFDDMHSKSRSVSFGDPVFFVLNCLFVDSGEIEECEFMKASYAVQKLHKLARAFGTSGVASAALTVVIITELVLIAVTLGFKVRLGLKRQLET